MQFTDLTLPTPAANLACDEALLDWCEQRREGEILRFWEPQDYFVVLGYGRPAASEVHLAACEAENVPVLRRCTGGGTVLQGPGCLNYSLILKIEDDGPLKSIPSANRHIMEQNRTALDRLANPPVLRSSTAEDGQSAIRPSSVVPIRSGRRVDNPQSHVAVHGHSDLAIGGRKFSGNAQRRRRHFLLFHGTFLLRFDLARMERFLPLPAQQPDYRHQRAHADFLTNLELGSDSVKRALRDAWRAIEPLGTLPREAVESLVRDKYATRAWNFKF